MKEMTDAVKLARYDDLAEAIEEIHNENMVLLQAIRQTLDDNGHLADGENCTLIALKLALRKIGVPWKGDERAAVPGAKFCLAVSEGETARAATAKNVFAFPATTTMTPEQALRSALEFATNDNLQDVLVAGYDGDGVLLVRSSRMDRKEALWLSEQMRRYALGDVA